MTSNWKNLEKITAKTLLRSEIRDLTSGVNTGVKVAKWKLMENLNGKIILKRENTS